MAVVRVVAASSLMSLAEMFWFRDYQWTAAEQLKWIPIGFLLVNGLLCLLISLVLARWLCRPEGRTSAPPK
jgi:hypothetical protein